MANYMSPGVYVEDVPPSVRPIEGVGTSTAGFLGVANKVTFESSVLYTAAGNIPVRLTSWEEFKSQFGDFQEGNKNLAHGVYGFFNNGGTACWIVRVINDTEESVDTIVSELQELMEQLEDLEKEKDKQLGLKKRIIASGGDTTAIDTVIAGLETQIDVLNNASTGTIPVKQTEMETALSSVTGTYTVDDYRNALTAMEQVDEVAIVAAPGIVDSSIQIEVLNHCINMKDRFAVIDGQRVQDKNSGIVREDIITDENSLALPNAEDGYGALYFPWIKVYDPVSEKNDFIAPSGHIAGIYARTDNNRGVHKAPANEVIRGALGVEHNLSRADQDALNPEGINAIRVFNGNVTVWGARTWADTSVDAEWKYIGTRRLINYIKESIEDGTRWVVFEPNDMSLWQKIKRNISAFLTNVWRDGALFGATPDEAFFVKCDAEINPSSVRDLGQVIIEIGISVVKPAEFVIFRIAQVQSES